MALLLDVTLLLTTQHTEVLALLKQLRALKDLLPPRAPLLAFVQEPDLREAAQQHLHNGERWEEYFHHIAGPEKLCRLMDRRLMSSKRQPAGTLMLRNAHKVGVSVVGLT